MEAGEGRMVNECMDRWKYDQDVSNHFAGCMKKRIAGGKEVDGGPKSKGWDVF